MKYLFNDKLYNVIVTKKNIKNSYIRVDNDLNIQVSANKFINEKRIIDILNNNQKTLFKMIEKAKNNMELQNNFYLLGKKYDIIIVPTINKIELYDNKLYVNDESLLKKWLKNHMKVIFEDRLKINYNLFEEKIPYPVLKLRNMTTRWGVCNIKTNAITLNERLITMRLEIIDYVIIHELSHFVHFNHSKSFWETVEKYCPNYKNIRKELRS